MRDIEMLHEAELTGEQASIPLAEESAGTKRLFELAPSWLTALWRGRVLCIDELDASLHPILIRRLAAMMHDCRANTTNAQLVFTAHDTALLDPLLLREDQVWFVEKKASGSSVLYSMCDFNKRPVHRGETMQKSYLTGRFGAIPIIDALEFQRRS